MLNLALAPVWCSLHINDGGISAERPPTNLHYTRQAGGGGEGGTAASADTLVHLQQQGKGHWQAQEQW